VPLRVPTVPLPVPRSEFRAPGCQRIKSLVEIAWVTSQGNSVSRHSVPCRFFKLNAPLVIGTMKPLASGESRAREAVVLPTRNSAAASRTEYGSRPLFDPLSDTAVGVVRHSNIKHRMSALGQKQTSQGVN